MILIHGALTLTSPLHTSAGTKGLRLQRDGRAAYKDNEGIPVVSNVTTPICIGGRYHADLPVFPSGGIIGRLRRLAAARIRAALNADAKHISQAMYYALTNGHAPGPQLGGHYNLADYQKVHADVFFGLFGGGSLRHAAAFTQFDLLPITNVTIDAAIVPPKFADMSPMAAQREVEPWQLFDYRVIRKVDDVARGRDEAAMVELIDAPEEKREAAVAYQTMPIGTPLYWKTLLADRTTPAQRGLFLLALRDLLSQQQIGARKHLGWGCFIPQRFRWINGTTRHDLFDFSQDEEGQPVMTESMDYHTHTKPAIEALEVMAKSPKKARDAMAELLNV